MKHANYIRSFLDAHPALLPTCRSGGSIPVDMALVEVPRGATRGPATDTLALQFLVRGPNLRVDVGAGYFTERCHIGHTTLQVPGEPTHFVVDAPAQVLCLSVPRERISALLGEGRMSIGDFGALHKRGGYDPFVAAAMHAIWDELARGSPGGAIFVDQALLALVARLHALAGRRTEGVPAGGGLAPWQIKRLIAYLEDHLDRDVGLSELAALVGLSTFHVCRAFKASTGLPPARWRLHRRIQRARELLERTGLPMTAIAAAVGYEDPGQFAVAFRRLTGATPSQYRKDRT